jgi:hypothetical protein
MLILWYDTPNSSQSKVGIPSVLILPCRWLHYVAKCITVSDVKSHRNAANRFGGADTQNVLTIFSLFCLFQPLPDVFAGVKLVLSPDIEDCGELERYFIAYPFQTDDWMNVSECVSKVNLPQVVKEVI